MASCKRAMLFGVVTWLIPFVVAIIVFPFRESWRALFESVMAVTVAGVAMTMALAYFKHVESRWLREGLLVGLLWFAICSIIDLPLMLTEPIGMTLTEYAADVALTYAIIPITTLGIGYALRSREAPMTTRSGS
ncbi:MAG: hypothetical protein JSU87_12840 [Gemmatimonadota bacterium]|nr:MAG: hypothetical protein JSU87_12840 [Gemmatimonadota bacterium]